MPLHLPLCILTQLSSAFTPPSHFFIAATNMTTYALLLWMIDGVPVEHRVSLRNGELLLSEYFLQSLLPPSVKFQGLQAVIQREGDVSHINVEPRWDHEDHKHYLLEHTLSSTYRILHSDACIYVSDSLEAMEDPLNDSSYATPCSKISPPVHYNIDTDEEEGIDGTKTLTSSERTQGTGEYTKQECSKDTSIAAWIVNRAKTSRLSKLLELCGPPNKVGEPPAIYNGNICFELPPTHKNRKMIGIEQKYDGHL